MSRFAAVFAVLGLITSPVVAETRLFCRYTGIEITDCDEREVPAVPVVKDAGCCDRRAFRALADANTAPDARNAVTPPSLVAPLASVPAPPSSVRVDGNEQARGAGPPIFVQHKAFLI